MREKTPRVNETKDFYFVKYEESHDLVIRRVGVLAGKIYKEDFDKWTTDNHFFIKIKNRDKVSEIIQQLESLNLEQTPIKYKTAGMPSISKTELCNLYINSFSN